MTKSNGKNGRTTLQSRDDYVLQHDPIILSGLLVRRSGTSPSVLVNEAIEAAGMLYDNVNGIDRETTPQFSQPIAAIL